jgi:ATP-dependent Clp protease protease subunit
MIRDRRNEERSGWREPRAAELAVRQAPRADDPEEEPEEDEEEDKEVALRESQVMLDILRKQRTVVISEPITPKLTRRILSQLLWLEAEGNAPIRLFINTPGGSADDGFALYDMVRFIQSPVYTICVGLNASAGTIVLLGAPKERRLALPNARIMIHQPSGGARGRATDVEVSAEEILKLRQRANEIIAAETGRTVEQVAKDTDKDYWLTAEEAKTYGLVSRVVSSVRDLK